MAQSIFSLIFCDAKSECLIRNTRKAFGPFCFYDINAAKAYLLNYIQSRIANDYLDALLDDFSEQLRLTNKPNMNYEEALLFLSSNQNALNFESLIPWFEKVTKGGFKYIIGEKPEPSFLECFCAADAIEVDEFFAIDIKVPSLKDALASPQTPIFDFSKIEGFDCGSKNPLITLDQALGARCDYIRNAWLVGDFLIRCFTVNKAH